MPYIELFIEMICADSHPNASMEATYIYAMCTIHSLLLANSSFKLGVVECPLVLYI